MNAFLFTILILEILVSLFFFFPLVLIYLKKNECVFKDIVKDTTEPDYAIIVTAYKQTSLLPSLISSIELLDYQNYVVYIVLDNCECFELPKDNFKIILLRPEQVLANNIESHRYAIDNFIRRHERITIIDSDNLVASNYLRELNQVFNDSFSAIQGARFAKNLNTDYANLDGISDLYYRYTDRKLLFEAGSSSTLSGSGMAFNSTVYLDFIKNCSIKGAGFDKLLQCYIVSKGLRIAFSNNAVVYDQKTTNSNQLVKQRSRWINTWFKSIQCGGKLFLSSINSFDRNKFLFSITLLRPPLFLMLTITGLLFFFNFFYFPYLNILLFIDMSVFLCVFFISLIKLSATKSMYKSLFKIPNFMFFQMLGLFYIKKADSMSVATEHIEIDNNTSNYKSKIKILHAIRQGNVGGGETHVLDLVKNLDSEKYESSILAFSNGPMIEELHLIKLETFVIETTTPFDIKVWNKVSKLMREKNFDILHVHGTRAMSNTFYAARKNSLPIVYTVHGWSFHPDQNKLYRWLRIQSEKFLISRANLTICVSLTNFNEGIERLGEFNSVLIRNGVNKTRFNPNNYFADIKEELNISKNEFLVGFIGRVTKQKNPMLLLQALASLPKDLPIKALFVGNGDLQKEMIKMARDLDINNRVLFLDFRKDVERILSAIDVYCLPSLWEGLSIGLLEAMAMRKTVIVSNISGNIEVIENLKNGIVIEQSPEALADGIIYLYKNKEKADELAKNAFLTIDKEFRINTMVEKVEEVYVDLLKTVES